MKKRLVTLLAVILLAGCAPKEVPISTPTETAHPPETVHPQVTEPAPTIAETEPEPEILQQPMIAVSLPLNIESIQDDAGLQIYRSSRQSIQLTTRDPEVANAITLDFLNRVDMDAEHLQSIRQAATQADTSVEYWSEYFYDRLYQPTRLDHSVLSMYGETVSFCGENHPQRICSAANYSTITGDILTLGSILYHIDAKEELAELVIESLDAIAAEKYLIDGYDDVVQKRFNRDESFDEDWYFSTTGLCFFFAPYEIAPYVSGVIMTEVPYSKLSGILADEFFPAEEEHYEGTIIATHINNTTADQFTQITELTVDPDGELYFFYTTQSVRNLQIYQTIDGEYGYSQDCTIFRTYTLTPGDAVAIRISPEIGSNAIFMTYESLGSTQSISLFAEFLGA